MSTPRCNPSVRARHPSGPFCHKFSLLLQAALPLGRRLRRRLGRAVGAFGPSARIERSTVQTRPLELNFLRSPTLLESISGGKDRIEDPYDASRPAAWLRHLHCGNGREAPDAAVKGPLRRPPAALDSRSSRVVPYARYAHMGYGERSPAVLET